MTKIRAAITTDIPVLKSVERSAAKAFTTLPDYRRRDRSKADTHRNDDIS